MLARNYHKAHFADTLRSNVQWHFPYEVGALPRWRSPYLCLLVWFIAQCWSCLCKDWPEAGPLVRPGDQLRPLEGAPLSRWPQNSSHEVHEPDHAGGEYSPPPATRHHEAEDGDRLRLPPLLTPFWPFSYLSRTSHRRLFMMCCPQNQSWTR